MAFKCSSCGGRLRYDIATRRMNCESCGGYFELSPDKSKKEDYHANTYERNVYQCKFCGAEITSFDDDASIYCPYCKSQALLYDKEEAPEPSGIIPFEVTESSVKKVYEEAVNKCNFVPKWVKEEVDESSFKGIYIPYGEYVFEADSQERIVFPERKYIKNNELWKEVYNVTAQFQGEITGMVTDVSDNFYDGIANEIAPYDAREIRDFDARYLAGFYADKATTDIDIYKDSLYEEAVEKLDDEMKEKTGCPQIPMTVDKKEFYGIKPKGSRQLLFPVWFMSRKTGDRMIYAVANGQTGKMMVDIPVDKTKVLLLTGAFTLVFFALLMLCSSFLSPAYMVHISTACLLFSSMMLSKQVKASNVMETNIFYKERLFPFKNKMRKEKGTNKVTKYEIKKLLTTLFYLVYVVARNPLLYANAFMGTFTMPFTYAVYVALMLILIVVSVRTLILAQELDNKFTSICPLLTILMSIVSFSMLIVNPVNDIWFIITAIANLLLSLKTGLTTIDCFDYLTTHPLPTFFERGEEE